MNQSADPRARPIGVFDSGVGGLTVFQALEAALPGESFVYLGDTARVPYGTRSAETVARYALEAERFLAGYGVKMLVVACNTASSVAIDELRGATEIPVHGVIGPGARRAARLSASGRIGVIGTRATVRSEAYPRAIRSLRADAHVVSRACPLFVPLAEEGWTAGEVARSVAEAYLRELRDERVDTLVLGCTHYPLLRDVIAQVMGGGVRIVDSAESVAEEIRARLHEAATSSGDRTDAARERDPAAAAGAHRSAQATTDDRGSDDGRHRFFVTDAPEPFQAVAERFLGRPIRRLERVRITGE